MKMTKKEMMDQCCCDCMDELLEKDSCPCSNSETPDMEKCCKFDVEIEEKNEIGLDAQND